MVSSWRDCWVWGLEGLANSGPSSMVESKENILGRNCWFHAPSIMGITTMLLKIYVKPPGEVIWRYGVHCHQYTDDTQFYLSFTSSAVDAVRYLSTAWHHVWNGLRLIICCRIRWRSSFWGALWSGNFLPKVDGVTLHLRDQVQNLGVHGSSSSWESDIVTVTRSVFNQLRLITQLCPYTHIGVGLRCCCLCW